MKISINYDVDEDVVRECSRITGLEASVDKSCSGEVIISFRNPKLSDRTVLLQSAAAGVNHFDLSQINEKIMLCSNAGAYNNALAELVFGLLLEHVKKICTFSARTKNGSFERERVGSIEGMTFGVLGYGGIGKQSARVAKAFDMRTIGYSRKLREDEYLDAVASSPEEIFRESDIVLIATPLSNETRGMVNSSLLGQFAGTYIINVARADIVDRQDMLSFLDKNPEKFFLTDVWWGEPVIKDPVPENAVLTPHIGGFADRTLKDATLSACRNVKRFLDGSPLNIVDLSEYRS